MYTRHGTKASYPQFSPAELRIRRAGKGGRRSLGAMETVTIELRPERYRSYLLALARGPFHAAGLPGHAISASGIVQEALLQAHKALPQFKGATEAELKGWLREILKNKLADAARRQGRQKRNAALEESICESVDASAAHFEKFAARGTTPSQYVLRRERELLLAEALADLPEDQAAAVSLRHLAGFSVDEIASELGRTNAAVAGLLRRGLQNLRERLKDLE